MVEGTPSMTLLSDLWEAAAEAVKHKMAGKV